MATKINGAAAIAPRTVRVTFDAAADATALALTAWTFTAGGTGPFYTPSAVSIVGVDSDTAPTMVDVTTDQEPTPGVLYTITCTGITGIPVDAIHNVGLFWALTPAAPSQRDYSLIDLIPPVNIAEDSTGDLAKFVACLQEIATLLWSDIDRWGDIFDIDKAPENFLDLLLAELGNPVELPDLTVIEKRKLCAVLVSIYKIKGTRPGLKAAVKFFVGLPAQISDFYGMGSTLGDATHASPFYLSGDPGDPSAFTLGGGDLWSFTVKCGTPGGVALTQSQIDRVTEIVQKTKPSVSRMTSLSASWVAPARADIKDNGGGSVTVTCAAVSGASAFQTISRSAAGVNEWNGAMDAMTGSGPASLTVSPGGTRYWVACAAATVPGQISNEVTNALTTPVLTATAQSRNIHLSWPAVPGAGSYRIYKSTSAKARPSATDNASNPIRIDGSASPVYDDPMESGQSFYYIVVPMIGESESFYSNEAHATST